VSTGTPQLPLRLRFPAPRRLEAFVPGENAVVVDALIAMAHGRVSDNVFLSGPEGSGKTHLLGAMVADTAGAFYLPLAQLGVQAELLIGAISPAPLICVDEIDSVAGNRDREVALFDLFNRVQEDKGRVVFAARHPPARLGIVLPDLVSRLSSLTQLSLRPLAESAARDVLVHRADLRGFELEEEVLDFLFRRFPRNLGAMLELIDHLDTESLAQRRRVTVPFVRSVVERVAERIAQPPPPDA